MRRIALIPIVPVDGVRTADIPTHISWVMLAESPNGQRALIKAILPDNTPQTQGTIADIILDEDGNQIEIDMAPLSTAQRNAIRTFLTNQGFDVSRIDATVNNRRKLLFAVLRHLFGRDEFDLDMVLHGYDINE